ncbi:MAG: WD40 repeat domain-containing protein, partial [Verrucomicrobiaceae bacterium]
LDADTGIVTWEKEMPADPRITALHLWPGTADRLIVERLPDTDNKQSRASLLTLTASKDEKPQDIRMEHPIRRLVGIPDSSDILLLDASATNRLHRLDNEGSKIWSWQAEEGSPVIEVTMLAGNHASGSSVVAVAEASGRVTALNPETGISVWTINNTGHGSHVIAGTFRQDSHDWIAITRNGIIRIWDTNERRLKRSIHGSGCRPRKVSFSSTGERALLHGDDGSVELWDLIASVRLNTLPADPKRVESIIALDGSYFLTGTKSGDLSLYLPQEITPVWVRELLPAGIDSLHFLAEHFVFAKSHDGFATTWKLPTPGNKTLSAPSDR